jgi:hypothetical protein
MNRLNSKRLVTLTDDQIRARAPSVFAEGAHESRSARFAYIPTHQILSGLRERGFAVLDVAQSRCRIPGNADFTKHMLKLTHPDALANIRGLGDSVPHLCLKNAHDGTAAYELSLGLLRLVCLNGMMVGDANMEVRVPHVGDVRGRVIEGAFEVIAHAGEITERAGAMQAVQLSAPERKVFARQAVALRFPQLQDGTPPPVNTAQALLPRRDADRGSDLWSTFNVLQENLIRGGQRYVIPGHRTEEGRYVPTKRMRTREVAGIDQNVGLNRALWRLAEEMRSLKAAA